MRGCERFAARREQAHEISARAGRDQFEGVNLLCHPHIIQYKQNAATVESFAESRLEVFGARLETQSSVRGGRLVHRHVHALLEGMRGLRLLLQWEQQQLHESRRHGLFLARASPPTGLPRAAAGRWSYLPY